MSSLTNPPDKSVPTMNPNPIQIQSDVPMPVFLSEAQIREALASMSRGQSFTASKHDVPNIRKIAKRLYYDIHIGKESVASRRIWLVQKPAEIPTVPRLELYELLEVWIDRANPTVKYGSFWRGKTADLLAELRSYEDLKPMADRFQVQSLGKTLVEVSRIRKSRVSVISGSCHHGNYYEIDLSPRSKAHRSDRQTVQLKESICRPDRFGMQDARTVFRDGVTLDYTEEHRSRADKLAGSR